MIEKFLIGSSLLLSSLVASPGFSNILCKNDLIELQASFAIKGRVHHPIIIFENKILAIAEGYMNSAYLLDRTASMHSERIHVEPISESMRDLYASAFFDKDHFVIGAEQLSYFDSNGKNLKDIETARPISAGPLMRHDGSVVVASGSQEGQIEFISPDGKVTKSIQLKYPASWLGLQPNKSESILAQGRGYLYWLDPEGNITKSFQAKAASYAPRISEKGVIAWPTDSGVLYLFSPSGQPLAEFEAFEEVYIPDHGLIKKSESMSSRPAFLKNGMLVVVGGTKNGITGEDARPRGHVHFMNAYGEEKAPITKIIGRSYVSPEVLEDGTIVNVAEEVYFFDSNGNLKEKFKRGTDSHYTRLAALSGSRVAVAEMTHSKAESTRDAKVIILNASGQVLGEFHTAHDGISRIQQIGNGTIAIAAWNKHSDDDTLFILKLK
ncbi:MAG: hypothetical protein JWQ35_466 [Bacteriovoracaceae bacterium]|nr:hypothetical protein [Bacteriovoracaceae bacterium]